MAPHSFNPEVLSVGSVYCSRKPLTCRAGSYDFDSLDLDAPEIDNDLESYQVGLQAAFAAPDMTATFCLSARPCAGTAGSQI